MPFSLSSIACYSVRTVGKGSISEFKAAAGLILRHKLDIIRVSVVSQASGVSWACQVQYLEAAERPAVYYIYINMQPAAGSSVQAP